MSKEAEEHRSPLRDEFPLAQRFSKEDHGEDLPPPARLVDSPKVSGAQNREKHSFSLTEAGPKVSRTSSILGRLFGRRGSPSVHPDASPGLPPAVEGTISQTSVASYLDDRSDSASIPLLHERTDSRSSMGKKEMHRGGSRLSRLFARQTSSGSKGSAVLPKLESDQLLSIPKELENNGGKSGDDGDGGSSNSSTSGSDSDGSDSEGVTAGYTRTFHTAAINENTKLPYPSLHTDPHAPFDVFPSRWWDISNAARPREPLRAPRERLAPPPGDWYVAEEVKKQKLQVTGPITYMRRCGVMWWSCCLCAVGKGENAKYNPLRYLYFGLRFFGRMCGLCKKPVNEAHEESLLEAEVFNLSYQDMGDPYQKKTLLTICSRLHNCRKLAITDSLVEELPVNLPQCEVLDLSRNEIVNIADLPYAPRLLVLNIGRNHLSEPDDFKALSKHFPMLQRIVVRGNPICMRSKYTTIIKRHGPPSLQFVDDEYIGSSRKKKPTPGPSKSAEAPQK